MDWQALERRETRRTYLILGATAVAFTLVFGFSVVAARWASRSSRAPW
jgi:hypothetical protein